MQIMYAISSSVFAAIFLVSIVVYGGDVSRSVAITAAMFATYSQFIAQDDRAQSASVVAAYISFALGLVALVSFIVEAFA